jgi:hypothetical protein
VDLGTGQARLARGLKNLRVQWDESEAYWKDTARAQYEEKHIVLLETLALAALREMDRLNHTLMQAQAECQ